MFICYLLFSANCLRKHYGRFLDLHTIAMLWIYKKLDFLLFNSIPKLRNKSIEYKRYELKLIYKSWKVCYFFIFGSTMTFFWLSTYLFGLIFLYSTLQITKIAEETHIILTHYYEVWFKPFKKRFSSVANIGFPSNYQPSKAKRARNKTAGGGVIIVIFFFKEKYSCLSKILLLNNFLVSQWLHKYFSNSIEKVKPFE